MPKSSEAPIVICLQPQQRSKEVIFRARKVCLPVRKCTITATSSKFKSTKLKAPQVHRIFGRLAESQGSLSTGLTLSTAQHQCFLVQVSSSFECLSVAPPWRCSVESESETSKKLIIRALFCAIYDRSATTKINKINRKNGGVFLLSVLLKPRVVQG